MINKNNVYYGIMGVVVGDALGVPYEFNPRGTFQATNMSGFGTHNQPPGTWSDDSSLTLATLASLTRYAGKINLEDIMSRFVQWWSKGEYTPYGRVFDCGNTTASAIHSYVNGKSIKECGGGEVTDNGNGSLMRILPLAFVPHTDEDIVNVSALTHAHPISTEACRIYLDIAQAIIEGKTIEQIKHIIKNMSVSTVYEMLPDLCKYQQKDIDSDGYVVHTLEAALWCFLTTNNYKECVLKAVNLGKDTDTVAAIAGGLAGLFYKDIPNEWVEKIARKEWIEDLCDEL